MFNYDELLSGAWFEALALLYYTLAQAIASRVQRKVTTFSPIIWQRCS
ncbi:MAG: hypothetical protein V7K47_13320 [Nostoc sp.]